MGRIVDENYMPIYNDALIDEDEDKSIEYESINDAAMNMTVDISGLESLTIKDGESEIVLDKPMLKAALYYIYDVAFLNVFNESERKSNETTIKVEDTNGSVFSGSDSDDWYSDTVWRQTE